MAYIQRRKYKSKTSYLAMVRRKGFKTVVKSFETKTDAKKWARAIERKLDTYDAISYGLFLGIPWEEFNKMIKLYCKKRGREGEWKTNEFGTQTIHFKND